MNRLLLGIVLAGGMAVAANATTVTFNFSAPGLAANGTLEVLGNQAVSGTGSFTTPTLSDSVTLVTLSTPGVHDLGGGTLSFRFGGGTDLIGDTFINPLAVPPVDGFGLVFMGSGPGHDGLNIWSNSATSFTGFLAGDPVVAGGGILYEGHDGLLIVTVVPEPVTMGLLGVGLLGLALVGRRKAWTVANGGRLALPAVRVAVCDDGDRYLVL